MTDKKDSPATWRLGCTTEQACFISPSLRAVWVRALLLSLEHKTLRTLAASTRNDRFE
jgi:hypothetical protein